MTRLGRALNLDDGDLAALERGGFLHDIGKIAVPDAVLLEDGQLDPHESRVMRKYYLVGQPVLGVAVAQQSAAHRPPSP